MDSIDDHYVWQCRIHHGIRNQKVALPFPESIKIGLEFNAAIERKEKLDQSLLTNAVMLEICDLSKTVTNSGRYFLFEMLEYNFELGVEDDDMQRYEYASRVYNKIRHLKEQVKLKPHRWVEAFQLPNPKTVKNIMCKVSGRYYPITNKIVDISVLTDGNKNRQRPENQKNEVNGAVGTSVLNEQGRFRLKSTDNVYPFCKKLGVSLTVRPDEKPKQKLSTSVVTVGVMMELLCFSRVLCGTQTQMVFDLVKQNFGVELDKIQFHLQLGKQMMRKYAGLMAEDRDAFRKQIFPCQINKRQQKHKKRKNPDTDFHDLEKLIVVGKRRETLRPRDLDAQKTHQDIDLSYMCPVDFETDVPEIQSCSNLAPEQNDERQPETAETTLAVSQDVKQEEEEVYVSSVQPEANGNTSLNQFLRNADENIDLFSDEYKDIKTKIRKYKVWTRRADRSEQILRSAKVNDSFTRSREIGLDFNLGSGNRQKLNLHLLTNWVLWEIFRFATAMTKSRHSFLLDILENNFNLAFQDVQQLQDFTFYVITKEEVLQSHPARQNPAFLNSPFQLPEIYNVNVTRKVQTVNKLKTEQQAKRDLSISQQMDMDPFPFCKKVGLNLWSTQELPPCLKRDLTALTHGAVLEISSFIRELCGSVQEIVRDVLAHNFDLDLQSGATKGAQMIQTWFVTQESLLKNQSMSPKIRRWLNTVVPLSGLPQLSPQPTRNSLENLSQDNLDLRGHANGRNHVCREIGLALNISSQSAARPKLDLQMLTRGVLLEVHEYVEKHCNRYVPDLYEILEYNFDLSSQSHRKVEFAWCIASQVLAMVGKNGRRGDYLNAVFELPMDDRGSPRISCKEEPEENFGEPHLNDGDEIKFIRKLKPVDIEVELE